MKAQGMRKKIGITLLILVSGFLVYGLAGSSDIESAADMTAGVDRNRIVNGNKQVDAFLEARNEISE